MKWRRRNALRSTAGAASPGVAYDAFISYSHAVDGQLAPALQRGLHRFARPWNRIRALRVFRDATSLSASPGLWPSIEEALGASRFLILLASPAASTSPWIEREVDYWLAHKSLAQLLVVVTEGELPWTDSGEWSRTSGTTLPAALVAALTEVPHYVDLRWARTGEHVSLNDPRFREAVADLAAPLHARPKDELFGTDVRQHRRTVRLARGAIAGLIALALATGVGAVLAVQQRDRAREERDRANTEARLATSRALANIAFNSLSTRPDFAALLSLQALRLTPTYEARDMVTRVLEQRERQVGVIRLGRAVPMSLALGADDKTLAAARLDEDMVQLWNIRSREQVAPPIRPGGSVGCVAFGPGDRTLALSVNRSNVAGEDRIVFWDIRRGRRVGNALAFGDDVSSLAFSRDGRELIAGGLNGTLRRWNVATRKEVPARPMRRDGPSSFAAFGAHGTVSVLTGDTQTAVFWDTVRGASLGAVPSPPAANAVAVTGDGELAAFGGSRAITLWDVRRASGVPVGPLRGHSDEVTSLAFTSDGRRLVSGARDGTIRLWNVEPSRGTSLLSRPLAPGRRVLSIAGFSADGHAVALHERPNLASLWSVSDRRELRAPFAVGTRLALEMRLSPDGRTVAAGMGNGTVGLWDVANGAPVGAAIAVDFADLGLAFAPDGKTLAVAGNDGGIHLVDVRRRVERSVLRGHADPPTGLAYSPSGDLLASSSPDRLRLWDVATGKGTTLANDNQGSSAVAFSPDGRMLVADSPAGLTFWDAIRRRAVAAPVAGPYAWSLSFSADGRTLAVGDESGRLRLWDVPTRRPLGHPLPANRSRDYTINAVDAGFSLDGTALLSVNDDTALLWDPILWSEDFRGWQRRLCGLLGRDLTRAEWAEALPGQAHQPTCP